MLVLFNSRMLLLPAMMYFVFVNQYVWYVYIVPACFMFSQALSRRHFSSGLPEHDVVGLPALSPVWKRKRVACCKPLC